jgi:histidyl-tRNA synthetase
MVEAVPAAAQKMREAIPSACEIFAIIADESQRSQGLKLIQHLREKGWNVDFPLAPLRMNKQFQIAEQLGARLAVIVGSEWPQVKVKRLATREEFSCPHEVLAERVGAI